MLPVTMINASATVGPHNIKKFNNLKSEHTVQAIWTGSPSAVTLSLEGSLDGLEWQPLVDHIATAAEITAKKTMFHVVQTPVLQTRMSILVNTGAGVVTAIYAADGVLPTTISRTGNF